MSEEKKIFFLGRIHPLVSEPDKNVCGFLEDLLEQAKRGEIKGIAVAWVNGGNSCASQFVEGSGGSSLLVAATSALFYDINKRWSNND